MENRTTIQVSEDLRKELRVLASKRDVSYQDLLKDMISIFKELDKEKTIISIPKKLSEKVEEKIVETDEKVETVEDAFQEYMIEQRVINREANRREDLMLEIIKEIK